MKARATPNAHTDLHGANKNNKETESLTGTVAG
jgi:hypothetical protein